METLLEVENITLGYSEDIDILHNVSINIAPSTITGMIGLNEKARCGNDLHARQRILERGSCIRHLETEPYLSVMA